MSDKQTNMTAEEAIAVIEREIACVNKECNIERACGQCELVMPSKEPIIEAYKLAIEALKAKPCTDAVSRQAVLDYICRILNQGTGKKKSFEFIQKYVEKLPSVIPEKTTITYKDCSEAMLKMWIDNVLTDGQYNKIMDKLNAKHIAGMKGVNK